MNHGVLVHFVHERDGRDEKYDTLLQTSWRLHYEKDHRFTNQDKPYVHPLRYNSVLEKVFVVEESPGIFETTPPVNRVMEISQKSEWSKIFLGNDW